LLAEERRYIPSRWSLKIYSLIPRSSDVLALPTLLTPAVPLSRPLSRPSSVTEYEPRALLSGLVEGYGFGAST